MGRKAKYTSEQKISTSNDYLSEKKSCKQIASELNMGKRGKVTVFRWAKKYQQYGSCVFEEKKTNGSYTKEFKKQVVEE